MDSEYTVDIDKTNTNISEPNLYSYPQLPNPIHPQYVPSNIHNISHASFQQSYVPTTQYTYLDTFSTTQVTTSSQAHTQTGHSSILYYAKENSSMNNMLPRLQDDSSTRYVEKNNVRKDNNLMERQVKEHYVGRPEMSRPIETMDNR